MIQALRRIHRRQVSRLRDLAVEVQELSAVQSRDALVEFAKVFMGAERVGPFLLAVDAAQANCRELDYGQWLVEGAPPPSLKPRFGWLSDWLPGKTCFRFDRRVALPALRLAIPRMLDEWAFSWPGAYASLESGRAMVVSLDCEVTCYDPSLPRKTPYR